jgi:hypothetical protein
VDGAGSVSTLPSTCPDSLLLLPTALPPTSLLLFCFELTTRTTTPPNVVISKTLPLAVTLALRQRVRRVSLRSLTHRHHHHHHHHHHHESAVTQPQSTSISKWLPKFQNQITLYGTISISQVLFGVLNLKQTRGQQILVLILDSRNSHRKDRVNP